MKAISPKEAREFFENNLPVFVIMAINDLILEKYSTPKGQIIITQEEAKNKITEAMETYNKDCSACMKWEQKFLNFESHYKKSGWDVTYQKKGIGDSFESHYVFKEKENNEFMR